jgi:peroxiredoxin
LHRSKERLEAGGFQIVLVGMGTPHQTEAFKRQFSLQFPMICDPDKKLYHKFGLGRGSVASMASPLLFLKGLKTLSRGYAPGMPQGDIKQMPGVFLIDTSGDIRYAHYSKNPSDNPSIETLLALTDIL